MATSNLDRLIVSIPHSDVDQYCTSSSSSQTPDATNTNNTQECLNLKIRLPSSDEVFEVSKCEDDLIKTPRSKEHRIPVMATCPPAPRKAKSVPVNRKRKAPAVGVGADFVVAMVGLNEVIYVPDVVVGDLGKKLKLLAASAHDHALIS